MLKENDSVRKATKRFRATQHVLGPIHMDAHGQLPYPLGINPSILLRSEYVRVRHFFLH